MVPVKSHNNDFFETFGRDKSCAIKQEPCLLSENPFLYTDTSTRKRRFVTRVVEREIQTHKFAQQVSCQSSRN